MSKVIPADVLAAAHALGRCSDPALAVLLMQMNAQTEVAAEMYADCPKDFSGWDGKQALEVSLDFINDEFNEATFRHVFEEYGLVDKFKVQHTFRPSTPLT